MTCKGPSPGRIRTQRHTPRYTTRKGTPRPSFVARLSQKKAARKGARPTGSSLEVG
ncbi:MAG: hypothetical protein J0I20_11485 [Chloroflexi bacterium]|nr:hypothetical protein [Chloroflexota bacterium]